ncbi:MAG: pantoate--beta-alanine ligase [Bacteroidetes bacterium]|nr:pantoate--beta-alanine ligase [Bacteroidota bacterium]
MTLLSLKDLVLKIGKMNFQNQSLGFVPTMGALHEGHLAIIERAAKENDYAVVSIFVNPTQFNNPDDLINYPRTLEEDLKLLSNLSNVYVFQPEVSEVYAHDIFFEPMPLGYLASLMEGKYRPGHFDGVVHVVHNLFRLVQPTRAYFGKKDYQQLAIIRMLVKHYQFPIEIVACETWRSEVGLALSSRNKRLSPEGLEEALIIWKTLSFIKVRKNTSSILDVKTKAISFFSTSSLTLEYLEFMNENTLMPAASWEEPVVCFIAAYCEGVRLIDNILV